MTKQTKCGNCGQDHDIDYHNQTPTKQTQKPSYTPGPWRVYEEEPGRDGSVGDFLINWGAQGFSDESGQVAAVYGDEGDREICRANARLIAAAPDYHQWAVERLQDHGACPLEICWCFGLQKIVDKAEGRS